MPTPVLLQEQGSTTGAGPATYNVALSPATSAGSMLLVGLRITLASGSPNGILISDDGGDTWSNVKLSAASQTFGSNTVYLGYAFVFNGLGGATTVHVYNPSAGMNLQISFYEFSNMTTSGSLWDGESSASGSGASGTVTTPPGAIVTTNAGDLIYVMSAAASNPPTSFTSSPPAGYTLGVFSGFDAWNQVGSAGSYNPAYSYTPSSYPFLWVSMAVALAVVVTPPPKSSARSGADSFFG